MKKAFFLLVLWVILVQLAGCNKRITGSGHVIQQTLALDSFTAVEIEGGFDVAVQQNAIPSGILTMEAEDNIAPLINARVVNRVLKIRYSTIDQIQTKKTPKIFVNAAFLERLYINGSGSIQTSGSWDANQLELRINGSGDIATSLQVRSLQVAVNGSGKISLGGKAVTTDANISGSGNIHAAGLISDKAKAVVSGSGTIYCGRVDQELDGVISGNGKIYYSGNPPTIRTQISGNGQIIRQ